MSMPLPLQLRLHPLHQDIRGTLLAGLFVKILAQVFQSLRAWQWERRPWRSRVRSAKALWFFVRTELMVVFSLVAAVLESKNALALDDLMRWCGRHHSMATGHSPASAFGGSNNVSPPFLASAFMNRDGEHEPNSILEPNAKDFEANTMNSLHDEGGHDYDDGPQDESRLCLLDSACTACMHSRRWRQAYERTLPAGLSCQKTDQTKVVPLRQRSIYRGQSCCLGDSHFSWRS